MNKHLRKKLHEEFHGNTSVHERVIKKGNFTYRLIIRILNKYYIKNMVFLDIGCGSGTLAFYLASKGNTVFGVDISKNAVEQCKRSAKVLGLQDKTSFEVVDFPDRSPKGRYDFVILTEVIEHLRDDRLAIQKIYSLLNPGGIVFITTPSKNAPMYRLGFANEFDKRVGHVRRYTIPELSKKLTDEGFSVIETKKTEGILRNFLFINPIAGKTIRYIKFFMSDIVTFFDNILCSLFGESNIFIVAQKKN